VVLVARLDRLARSTRDLLNIMAVISENGAGFRSLMRGPPRPYAMAGQS
jgi:DNA invertase Pin-like site-specific DNA recombinase